MGSKKVYIFLGPPGAGKGTQAKMLAKELGIPHVSVGEIVRSKLKENPNPEWQAIYDRGDLFPDELIMEWAKKIVSESSGDLILDGSIRTLFEAEDFSKFLDAGGYETVIFNIAISPEETLKRNLKRARDKTDTEEVIKERLEEYNEKTGPALEFLKDKVVKINGEQSIEQVHRDIWEYLGEHP